MNDSGPNWAKIQDLARELHGTGVPLVLLENLTLWEVEGAVLRMMLAKHGWSQKLAAQALGISPRVMNYKVKRHGIRHKLWYRHRERAATCDSVLKLAHGVYACELPEGHPGAHGFRADKQVVRWVAGHQS